MSMGPPDLRGTRGKKPASQTISWKDGEGQSCSQPQTEAKTVADLLKEKRDREEFMKKLANNGQAGLLPYNNQLQQQTPADQQHGSGETFRHPQTKAKTVSELLKKVRQEMALQPSPGPSAWSPAGSIDSGYQTAGTPQCRSPSPQINDDLYMFMDYTKATPSPQMGNVSQAGLLPSYRTISPEFRQQQNVYIPMDRTLSSVRRILPKTRPWMPNVVQATGRMNIPGVEPDQQATIPQTGK